MTDVNIKKLKVVFVDWYITLTSMMFLNRLKLENPELFEKINNKIFEKNSEGWHFDWARGKISQKDVADIIADDGYMSYDEVLKTFADCCSVQQVDTEEFWPVIEKIRHKGIKVVMATDNWDIFCQYTIPALKLKERFDDILSSNEVGYMKRDVEDSKLLFFEDYMAKNHLSYDDVILIDDGQINAECCHACGMPIKQVASSADTLAFLKEIAEAL